MLIWATFIAAADCVLDEHKAYFEALFLKYYARSGFANILTGLQQLRKIWASKSETNRWTCLLPVANVFIM